MTQATDQKEIQIAKIEQSYTIPQTPNLVIPQTEPLTWQGLTGLMRFLSGWGTVAFIGGWLVRLNPSAFVYWFSFALIGITFVWCFQQSKIWCFWLFLAIAAFPIIVSLL